MGSRLLRCAFCHEDIGAFDDEAVSAPLLASFFTSPDKLHDYPDPFLDDEANWENLRCPVCGLRPFPFDVDVDDVNIGPTVLLTPEGEFKVSVRAETMQEVMKVEEEKLNLHKARLIQISKMLTQGKTMRHVADKFGYTIPEVLEIMGELGIDLQQKRRAKKNA